jgi:hypothetical protein
MVQAAVAEQDITAEEAVEEQRHLTPAEEEEEADPITSLEHQPQTHKERAVKVTMRPEHQRRQVEQGLDKAMKIISPALVMVVTAQQTDQVPVARLERTAQWLSNMIYLDQARQSCPGKRTIPLVQNP